MVSIFSFLPEYTADNADQPAAPHVAIGAASPLWLMFGGAAAAGATYWWWANRWREAVNLESLMALAHEPVAPPAQSVAVLDASPEPVPRAVTEPVVEAVTLVAETTETVLDATQEIVETAAEPVVAANEDVAEAVVEPVEAAVETVEEVAPVLADGVDDLTKLVGVGPKLAASLADLGVTKFSQIAAWTPDELSSFDQLLNLKGRADRDAWIAQAQKLAEA